MSTSIRTGVMALQGLKNVEAAIILTCDQPFVSSEILDRMIDAYRRKDKSIVACQYGGTVGIPALFDRRFFPELLSLKGDLGARRIIKTHSNEVQAIAFPGAAVDINTRSDYEAL